MSIGIARCNKDLVNNTDKIDPSFTSFTLETFPIARLNDIITGSSDKVNRASTKFFINGKGVARLNDTTVNNHIITSASQRFFTN